MPEKAFDSQDTENGKIHPLALKFGQLKFHAYLNMNNESTTIW